ncbi:MAG: class I SAM-dependent methyltransferase [Eubacteriales bacterium]
MAMNADKIIARYCDGSREEGRSICGRYDYAMEYKYTKRLLDKYITKQHTVLEVGCGTGYYGMYLADKCKSYTGVDITPGNINVFNMKICNKNLTNLNAFIGDATNLCTVDSGFYDIVLTLGPMYHLPPSERDMVFAESGRVCKPGGIIMFAYINKMGHYITGCLSQPDKYPNPQKNKSILRDGIDDTREDIYWFSSPEEMEREAEKSGLYVLENLGVDFLLIPDMCNLESNRRNEWGEIADILCAGKSYTGFSNHAVMVCRNKL